MLYRLSRPRWRILVGACTALLTVSLATALAQRDEMGVLDDRPRAPEPNPPTAGLLGNDPLQGVYVRDSAAAVEKMVLAQRMERLKEWNKSADVYQEILRDFSDRVVPAQVDKDNRIYQYTSVTAAVQERLAKWPEEGLRVYRGLFDIEASRLLEQAGTRDVAPLHRVYTMYFVTDAGKTAGIRLIDLYIRNGEFSAAAWIGDRLLRLHPSLRDERAIVLYRTAIAHHLAGGTDAAEKLLAQLNDHHADARGTIRGEHVVLAESLQRELESAHPIMQPPSPQSWPMAFGSPDRARVLDVSASGGARLFGVELPRPDLSRFQNPQERLAVEGNQRDDRAAGQMTGVLPAVDRGELFFQDNVRVYAVNLDSGLPLPGWAATWTGERRGRYTADGWPMPRNQQFTVTVTDDAVLAVLGQSNRIDEMSVVGRRNTRLVCLDRATGAERWVVQPNRLPPSAGNIRELDLVGSVIVAGDSVFVAARGGRANQFEDVYVLCFDLAGGNLKWSCYLASANTQFWDGNINNLTDTIVHLAYSSGRLYALTNNGAVAAVDAYDGTIIWLNLYPREAVEPVRPRRGFGGGWTVAPPRQLRKPWSYNPVVVADGHIFLLPADSKHVFVYDAGSGIEVQRIKTSDFDNASTLLGVIDERMILAGEKEIACINWRSYDAESFQRTDAFWIARAGAEEIRGRGFVTREWVYFPTNERLLRADMANGKLERVYPPGGRKWEEDEMPGNILVTQDQVIVAGPERVDVYADLSVVQRKLDALVAAAPDKPEPRLRYAEMMFVAGDLQLAMTKLDEAIALMGGGSGSMPAGNARDQVFAIATTFAQKLMKQQTRDAGTIAAIEELFDRAAAAAGNPAQQVSYRIDRARFAGQIQSLARQIELYQQILLDPQLRTVPVVEDESAGAVQAGVLAERAIAQAIRRPGGAKAYEPFEQAAVREAEAARATGRPPELLAVAQRYPNAKIASQAMLAAADAYESAGNPLQATQVLRRLYMKYPTHPAKAQVIEAMARNYLALDRVDVATSRLAHGARLPDNPRLTRPLKLPDGRVLSEARFSDALAALQDYQSQQAHAALPDFRIPPLVRLTDEQRRAGMKPPEPFARPGEAIISDMAHLLVPAREFLRHDRVVTASKQGVIHVFAPGETSPLLSSRALTDAPQGAAWSGEHLLVWSASKLALIDGQSGETMWESPLTQLPALGGEPAQQRGEGPVAVFPNRGGARAAAPAQRRAPGDGERTTLVRLIGDRVVFATSHGRVAALDLDDGSVLWHTSVGPRNIERLLANDDFVVSLAGDDSAVQLLALDSLSGEAVYRRNFTRGEPTPLNAALAPDGKLVFLLPDQFCAKDLLEPGETLLYSHPGFRSNQSAPAYSAGGEDQLVIADGRVLVVAEGGQFVHVHSLETGRLLQFDLPGQKAEFSGRLATRSKEPDVALRTVGSRLYAIGPRSLMAYNLDDPGDMWDRFVGSESGWRTVRSFIGQDDLLVIDEAVGVQHAPERPRIARIIAFSRRAVVTDAGETRESGLPGYVHNVTDRSGILQWQPVEGGLYYLAADGKLHYLQGAGTDG